MAQPLPERRLSLSDQVHSIIERLYPLAAIAENERRPEHRSNEMLDGFTELGRILCRMGRG